MPRYKLTIAYDGTDFCGWQKQEPPAHSGDPAKVLVQQAGSPVGDRVVLRTVQEVVERSVREVVREPIQVQGASRTDAGVHARAQVGAFTCTSEAWPAERGGDRLLRALNSRLPDDVLILAVDPVPEDFDPIAHCTAKGYSYTLHISPHRPLWDRRFVHHVWARLDPALMADAARLLVGEHDFAAFAAAGHGRLSTVRTIYSCDVVPEGETRIRVEVSGSGFLYNMVRIIAGTLVEVGRGRLTTADIFRALGAGDRRLAGPTLAPRGLCLEWVRYADPRFQPALATGR